MSRELATGGGMAVLVARMSEEEGLVVPSFEDVYELHFAFVWRMLRRWGVDEASLDDAAQDVFIVVHRKLPEFEGRSTLRSWLFGIARRVAKDHRRRRDRKDRGKVPLDELRGGGPGPRHSAEAAEARALLRDFLASLDEDKRDVFILAELEQMSAPEIAASLAVNLNTVYSRLRVARKAFEDAVARHRARARREADHE